MSRSRSGGRIVVGCRRLPVARSGRCGRLYGYPYCYGTADWRLLS